MLSTLALLALPALASSHREAPLIAEDAVADNTDLWAFTSPENNGTVSIVAGYVGFEDPAGGPNWMHFSDDVLYEIKIDNNGAGVANDEVLVRLRGGELRIARRGSSLVLAGPARTVFSGFIDVRPRV